MYQISDNLLVNSQLKEKYQWLNELQDQNISDFQINLFRVWCMDISNDLSLMAVGGISKDHTVFIYNQHSMALCNQIYVTSHQVYLLLFSQQDKYLCAGCYGKQILLWEVDDIKQIQNAKYKRVIQTEFGVIARILFFDNERKLCFQGQSHLFIIDLEMNSQAKIIKINHKPQSFDINQSKLFEVGKSSVIYIRDICKDQIIRFICCNVSQLDEIVVSKKNYFLVASSHQNIFCFNTINGKLLRKSRIFGRAQSIKLSEDDKFLTFVSMQASVQLDYIHILNLETDQLLLKYATQLSQPTFINKMMPKKFIFGKINSIEIWNLIL
ncbi:unnamed protein product [Paramecium primaurelia]|uniref:Uncharacterized protein n=1 Tax=Paramecium primaurelia TaxID=5886 RepID=A0A8S1PU37_PARPR|nr:unnamed protein product [Paramecium primaurelia]